MMFPNKKGDMFGTILIIIIMLVLFFMLSVGMTDLLNGIIDFAPDAVQRFMLVLFVPALLIGIVTYIFKEGQAGR